MKNEEKINKGQSIKYVFMPLTAQVWFFDDFGKRFFFVLISDDLLWMLLKVKGDFIIYLQKEACLTLCLQPPLLLDNSYFWWWTTTMCPDVCVTHPCPLMSS